MSRAVPTGLSSGDAARRLTEFGRNEIRREEATSPLILLARQFASSVIWLLLGATIVSLALGELLDAIAIGVIVIVNAAIGCLQEHRAERAVMALRSMTAPRARVVRDGQSIIVPASRIVPGDVLVLEAGDIVAADARLLISHTLSTSEAALTGESTPVEKSPEPTAPDTPLAERRNYVFMGTSIATSTGLAEVTTTGMLTELGRIAHLLATAEDTGHATAAPARSSEPDTGGSLRGDCAARRRCGTATGISIQEIRTAPRPAWQNAYVERVIGSIRRECLDHIVVLNETGLARILNRYLAYYHQARTDLSLAKNSPRSRSIAPPVPGPVVGIPQVGGLHHRYDRRAAWSHHYLSQSSRSADRLALTLGFRNRATSRDPDE